MAPGIVSETQATMNGPSSSSDGPTAKARLQLDAAIARFEKNNTRSKELHEKAACSLPGGNTRTLLHTSPFPISMKCGRGYQVQDEDGNEYTDFVGELSAGLYGHSNPIILDAIRTTIDNVGMNLGATTVQEAKYAELLCSRFNLERIRFCNSGTEANLHALAAARRHTGKRKVVVFKGGYHGAVLSFGAGVAPNGVDVDDWLVARYNDVEAARAAIEETEGVAAVIVEAMQGAGGCIRADVDFLRAIEASAKKAGAVFVLDEVMTSRMAPGGLHSKLGLSPDLVTLGKYLGGGLAFGAFGGRADIMAVYDPRLANSMAHSGTFNNNTLAMHAGYAGLSEVYTAQVCIEFTAMGNTFRQALQKASVGTKCSCTGLGTLIGVHFSHDGAPNGILRGEDVIESNDLKDLFWLEMLEQGFWMTRRGMIAMVLGTPQEELDRFVEAVKRFLSRYEDIVKV